MIQTLIGHTTITWVEIIVPIFGALLFLGLIAMIWLRHGRFEPEYQPTELEDDQH